MEHLLYFFKDLKQVGAIAPSSKFLAKDLVAKLRQRTSDTHCPPLNILEIGAGTGPLTKQITKHLRPKDNLDIVEIHEKFYQIIKEKYQQTNIHIHNRDILNFKPGHQYNFIFSSLPYENMPEKISQQIWKKKLDLCCPDAHISYFKYLKFRNFKSDFEEKVVKQFGQNKKFVFLNLPPAKIYTLEISQEKGNDISFLDNVSVV